MEKIKLSVPSEPKYLTTLRLVASSIANNEGFDIEKIEDIKVLVSEIFTYLLPINKKIKIKFLIDDDFLKISFKKDETNIEKKISEINFELKKQILLALSDDLLIDENKVTLIMNKG